MLNVPVFIAAFLSPSIPMPVLVFFFYRKILRVNPTFWDC